MVDTAKINAMTDELEKFVKTYNDIYLMPETFTPNIFALLKKFDVRPKAALVNNEVAPNSQILGCPLVSIADAIPNFNLTVGIIYFSAKIRPEYISSLNFEFGAGSINLPAFVISYEEADAIYDKLTVLKIFQQHQEDDLPTHNIASRFVNGLSTFMNPAIQDIKVQYWDRQEFGRKTYSADDAAIVIQGPLEYKDSYTATTAQIYRQIYPNAPIVISTWKGEATEGFREFCNRNSVVLLENDLPEEPGGLHVNYQLESSYRGIRYVKENTAAKFVLKCRTDQRVNLPGFLNYFKNLLAAFPPNGDKTSRRIILLNENMNNRWAPFYVCDYLAFGAVNDLERLYGIPRQSREAGNYFKHIERRFHFIESIIKRRALKSDSPFPKGLKWKNYNVLMSKFDPPETFIMKSFCNLCVEHVDPERLSEIFLRFVKNYTIFVDGSAILFDWCKYPYWLSNTFYFPHCNDAINIDSANWLDIYLNFKTDDEQRKN